MQAFKLTAQVTVSAYTRVDAETLDEAIKIARGRLVTLGQEGVIEFTWVIGEADGEPCETLPPAGLEGHEPHDIDRNAEPCR